MRRDLEMLVGLWRAGRLPIEKLISGTADLKAINEVVAAQRDGSVVRTVLTMN
jgi:S-(hydroxymethyl)glutathione dehydrogenase/alcohol dehydrogenase